MLRNHQVSVKKGDEMGCECLSPCKVKTTKSSSKSFKSAKSKSSSESFKSAKSKSSSKSSDDGIYGECRVSNSCRKKYNLDSLYDKCIPGETANRQYLQRNIGLTKKKNKKKKKKIQEKKQNQKEVIIFKII